MSASLFAWSRSSVSPSLLLLPSQVLLRCFRTLLSVAMPASRLKVGLLVVPTSLDLGMAWSASLAGAPQKTPKPSFSLRASYRQRALLTTIDLSSGGSWPIDSSLDALAKRQRSWEQRRGNNYTAG